MNFNMYTISKYCDNCGAENLNMGTRCNCGAKLMKQTLLCKALVISSLCLIGFFAVYFTSTSKFFNENNKNIQITNSNDKKTEAVSVSKTESFKENLILNEKSDIPKDELNDFTVEKDFLRTTGMNPIDVNLVVNSIANGPKSDKIRFKNFTTNMIRLIANENLITSVKEDVDKTNGVPTSSAFKELDDITNIIEGYLEEINEENSYKYPSLKSLYLLQRDRIKNLKEGFMLLRNKNPDYKIAINKEKVLSRDWYTLLTYYGESYQKELLSLIK